MGTRAHITYVLYLGRRWGGHSDLKGNGGCEIKEYIDKRITQCRKELW